MAAGRGDGQLAVRVQPLIHSGRRQPLAAVVKAGHGQHYGLLPGEIEIGLGADQMLGALLTHEVEEGLLPAQIEDQVDPGHTTKTGVNPVQLLDEIIQGDGGEQVLGEGEKAVIPDGEMSVNGMALTFSILASRYICMGKRLQSATTVSTASAIFVRCYN